MTTTTKLRAKEAAEYLRVSNSTLSKMRCYGGGPRFAKAGARVVLYDRADLEAWLAARMVNSTGEHSMPAERCEQARTMQSTARLAKPQAR